MVKWLFRSFLILLLLFVLLFWQMFFSARPPLMTEAHTLAGDGSALNYCELPILDGSGKTASEIPKGNTPGCAYSHFPLPILAECTQPLASNAADMRGLWVGVDGKVGHIERVEQCGRRVVITSSGIIHDGGPNSTGGENSNDTEGSVLFTVGEKDYCGRTSASMTWNNDVLEFNVFGWGPIVVKRYMDGDQLVWEYADGSVTRMDRLCTLPEDYKVPRKRGARYTLF